MAKDNKVLKVLRTARGLVNKGWTTGALAMNKNGKRVPVKSPEAVNFCAIGALRRAEFKLGTVGAAAQARIELRKALPKNAGTNSIVEFNDYSAGKDGVVALFDRAIQRVSK
jgi:hypothetical protein